MTIHYELLFMFLFALRSSGTDLVIENSNLRVEVDSNYAVLSVTDKRLGKIWSQQKERPNWPIVTGYSVDTNSSPKVITMHCRDSWDTESLQFDVKYTLMGEYAELGVEIIPTQDATISFLDFPHPFTPESGTEIILAHRIGIAMPVDETDTVIAPDFKRYFTYHGGDGCSMPFCGIVQTNDGASVMTTLITPYDAGFKMVRESGLLYLVPCWQAELGEFSYSRKLQYSFFTSGGHVTIAKRYRQMINSSKITLDEKIQDKAALSNMTGAACFATANWSDITDIGTEMSTLGMDRVFWYTGRLSPSTISNLVEFGHLVTRYDNYRSAVLPEDIPYLTSVFSHFMRTPACPQDLIRTEAGSFYDTWKLNSQDEIIRYAKGIADNKRYKYASKRFSKLFDTFDYDCIYLDTEAASPILENWDINNPCTRSMAKEYKIDFYNSINTNFNKILGMEGGYFAYTPYVDYFCGNRTLIPFTLTGGGAQEIFPDEYVIPVDVRARLEKSHRYYIPLWPLVYGDSVHLFGGYNPHNILDQAVYWDREDAISMLYGMSQVLKLPKNGAYGYWSAKKTRIQASYDKVGYVMDLRGTSLMENHEYITPDRNVQRTTFSNGLQVIVNFGTAPYICEDLSVIGQYEVYVKAP